MCEVHVVRWSEIRALTQDVLSSLFWCAHTGRLLMDAAPTGAWLRWIDRLRCGSGSMTPTPSLGGSAPGGTVVLGVISSWAGRGVSCQLALHVWQMVKSNPLSFAAWWEKGRRDFSRCWPRDTSPQLCREVGCRVTGGLGDQPVGRSSLRRGAGSNAWEYRQKRCWCRPETSCNQPHGVVQGCVKFLGVRAPTPRRGSVFRGTVYQS